MLALFESNPLGLECFMIFWTNISADRVTHSWHEKNPTEKLTEFKIYFNFLASHFWFGFMIWLADRGNANVFWFRYEMWHFSDQHFSNKWFHKNMVVRVPPRPTPSKRIFCLLVLWAFNHPEIHPIPPGCYIHLRWRFLLLTNSRLSFYCPVPRKDSGKGVGFWIFDVGLANDVWIDWPTVKAKLEWAETKYWNYWH